MIEIHITTQGIIKDDIDKFIVFCNANNFKPIIIELNEGDHQQQPMISKVLVVNDRLDLLKQVEDIKIAFLNNGYEVRRLKVEVPLKYAFLSKELFPDYKGQYGEWHGKVQLKSISDIDRLKTDRRIKVSNSSLKGEGLKRFVTYRHYGDIKNLFEFTISSIKAIIKSKNLEIVKEEAEYCIYDSNKSLDKGWIDTPEITDVSYLKSLILDDLVKRFSFNNDRFLMKGSLVTRQFLKDKEKRIANDIDFVFLDENTGGDVFRKYSTWLEAITTNRVDDKIDFKPFSDDDFWRRREYAMNDDFPTTNTDLLATVNGALPLKINLDISWGLPVHEEIVRLKYICNDGDQVDIPIVSLPLQISWKLHQVVVRPRSKDFVDLIYLMADNELSNRDIEKIKFHFSEECKKDNINFKLLNEYSNGNIYDWISSMQTDEEYIDEVYECRISENKYKESEIPFEYVTSMNYLTGFFTNLKFTTLSEVIKKFEIELRRNKIIL